MKQTRWGSFLLIAVLIISMAFPVQAASKTDEISNLEQEQSQDKQNLNSAQQKVNNLEDSKSNLEMYLNDLNAQLTELNNSLIDLEAQAATKEEELLKTQEELSNARAKESKQYEDMKKRIQYMYESSDTQFLELLFSAETFTDFLNRAENISQISTYDRNMLQEFQDTKDLIQEKESAVAAEKQEIEELQTQTASKQQEVTNLFSSTSGEISEYANQIAVAENEISSYENQIHSRQSVLDDLIRQAEEEEARRQAEEEAARIRAEEAVRAQQEADRKAQEQAANQQTQNNTEQQSSNTQADTTAPETKPDTSTPETQAPQTSAPETSAPETSAPETSGGGQTASNPDDLALLAAIIQCEAGGESYEGQIAVGAVVMNRVNSGSFPNSIFGVIYQSGQFSPVASGRLALVLAQGARASCVSAAQEAMNGANNVGGALFFKVNDGTPGLIIGNHVFY